ncbi:MAG: TonB-dependent receptor [Prevotella sp.]|nr:TonB-dependent receptor [Prevotella sp.]
MKSSVKSIFTFFLAALGMGAAAQEPLKGDSLGEVVVTGTGTQHLLRNAPVQTEVISGRQLRQYGGRSLEDILGGLSASFAFNEGDMGSQMQLNGLGNSYILVLVDGKRLHGDVGGENDLQLIDPHNIERIEIVKGASSALYGSDAIAGVVNIITKRHDDALLVENSTRLGSYSDLRQHNGLGLAWGKLKSYTNFQLQHSDGWQNTATEWTPSSAAPVTDSRNKTVNEHTNWQLSEQLTWTLSPRLELTAGGTYYRKGIYRPKGKYPKYDVKTFDMKYRNASASIGGKWRHGLTMEDGDLLTLDIDWNRHAYYHAFTSTTLAEGFDEQGRFILDYPYFAGQENLQTNQERTMAHLKGVFSLPHDHRLSAGLEARYDYLRAPTSIAGKTASDNTEALYVQDEWRLPIGQGSVTAHLTPGLRLNRNQAFGLRLTPKLSAMLSAGNLRLRVSWSQGFKTPTLKEQNYRYLREMTTIIMYLGNKDLKPQTSNYYALNAEYTWGDVNLTVTGYYNKLDNMITLVTVPRNEAPDEYRQQYGEMLGKVRRYQNMEDARTSGVDVSLRYAHKEISAGLGYSYLDTDAHVYDADHERLKQVTIDGMAHHKGNVFLTWQHEAKGHGGTSSYGAGLYGRFSTKRYYQLDGNGKGYHTWRLAANYRFTLPSLPALGMSVEAGVDNIFNYCDRTPHGLHLGTTTPGRTVYATLSVSLKKGKRVKFTDKSNLKNKQQDDEQD